ncbi:MAG: hypothetical protein ACOCRK_07380 [bacterium]
MNRCPFCESTADKFIWFETQTITDHFEVFGDCEIKNVFNETFLGLGHYEYDERDKEEDAYAECLGCHAQFDVDTTDKIILLDQIRRKPYHSILGLGYEEQMIEQFKAEAIRLRDWETAMFRIGGLYADISYKPSAQRKVIDYYLEHPELLDYIKIAINDDVGETNLPIDLLTEGLFQYHHYLLFTIANREGLTEFDDKPEDNANNKCESCHGNAYMIPKDSSQTPGNVCDFCDKWVCQDCLDKILSGEIGNNVCTECAQKIDELEEDIRSIYSTIFNEQPNQDLVLDVADEIIQNYKVENWTKSVAKSTLINTIKDLVGDKY